MTSLTQQFFITVFPRSTLYIPFLYLNFSLYLKMVTFLVLLDSYWNMGINEGLGHVTSPLIFSEIFLSAFCIAVLYFEHFPEQNKRMMIVDLIFLQGMKLKDKVQTIITNYAEL